MGLGYEISSVAIPDLLSADNREYVRLVRALSRNGVIRIGGNTSDYSRFAREGKAVSEPKGTVVNGANLRQLATFLNAINWRLIWGLNLGSADEQQAIAEAEAVMGAVGDKLLAFEIGNEPDLFNRGTRHRPKDYGYEAFLKEFRRYKAAIRAKLPNAPFAGPDAATATDWVTRFAADEGSDLKLLTHHYYRQCAGPTSTLNKLLHVDPKLAPMLDTLRSASLQANVPYRICETNSFCGGGQPGVSDTFGAALWVLDFLFQLAYAGCAGVNIETGVNQLGFVSYYSPIRRNDHGEYAAMPVYYGMAAFAHVSQGRCVAVNCDAAGPNVSAYAVLDGRTNLSITIINKETSADADVDLLMAKRFHDTQVLRLSAPSLQSKESVTFADSNVSLHSSGSRNTLHVPARSAAVLKLSIAS